MNNDEEKIESNVEGSEVSITKETIDDENSGNVSITLDNVGISDDEEVTDRSKKISLSKILIVSSLGLTVVLSVVLAILLIAKDNTIDIDEILNGFDINETIDKVEYLEYTSIEDGEETYLTVGLNDSNKYQLTTNLSYEPNIYYDIELDSYVNELTYESINEEYVIKLVQDTIKSVITNTLWYSCFVNDDYFISSTYETNDDLSLITFIEDECIVKINNYGLITSVSMPNLSIVATYVFK